MPTLQPNTLPPCIPFSWVDLPRTVSTSTGRSIQEVAESETNSEPSNWPFLSWFITFQYRVRPGQACSRCVRAQGRCLSCPMFIERWRLRENGTRTFPLLPLLSRIHNFGKYLQPKPFVWRRLEILHVRTNHGDSAEPEREVNALPRHRISSSRKIRMESWFFKTAFLEEEQFALNIVPQITLCHC